MAQFDQKAKNPPLSDALDVKPVPYALCEVDGHSRFLGRDDVAFGSFMAKPLDHPSLDMPKLSRRWISGHYGDHGRG